MWKTLYNVNILDRQIELMKADQCWIALHYTSAPIKCVGTDNIARYFNNYLSIQLMKKFKIGIEKHWYDGWFYDYYLGFIGVFYTPCR